MSSVQEGSWNDLLGGRNLFFSIALSGGVALHAINIYIATTVLPSVVNEIGGLELYSWNTTLFVVASILGSALTSRLLALVGARKAYLVAVMLFIAGSLVCALAQTMPVMLAGRALQGLGGGFFVCALLCHDLCAF
ncbi:MFS transporter [Pantoea tagorei]